MFSGALDKCKAHAADAARCVLDSIAGRFPDPGLLVALCIIYPQHWAGSGKGTAITTLNRDDLRQHIATICTHYGRPMPVGVDGVEVPALLSRDGLVKQGGAFLHDVKATSCVIMKQYDEAVKRAGGAHMYEGPSPASMFWRVLAVGQGRIKFPEYVKLAKLTLTMVGGSIEEERSFSSMNYIKSLIRNRLQENHLNCTVRPFVMRSFFQQMISPSIWHAKFTPTPT